MSDKEIRDRALRKSRFSFSSKDAKRLGDDMMKHYIALSEKIKPL